MPNTSVQRRDALRIWLNDQLAAAQRSGRGELTEAEQRAYDDLRDIEEELTRAEIPASLKRIGGAHDRTPAKMNYTADSHLTYRRGDRSRSWVRDLMLMRTGNDPDGESQRRLTTHANEVAADPAYLEHRDLSRVDGQGGYAVPPAWLMDEYVELARPGRAFANLVQRKPLPGGTDSINIPKVLTGTVVGVQTADNQTVADVDLTDTFISAPVRTIAGQQSVAIQLLDQSPLAYDDLIFRDLVSAHAGVLDNQVIYGSGTSGQVLGVENTPGISTIAVSSMTAQGIYASVANAIQTVHTTRFQPPEVIVMHPRRWGALLAESDDTGRPLFIPRTNGPMNVQGILTDVASQQVVGEIHGLPVVTDPNISITSGSETPSGTEDVVYVLRASDLVLWESGIRARVLPEVKASNLTVVLQCYSYVAFSAERYPASVVAITGFTPPQW